MGPKEGVRVDKAPKVGRGELMERGQGEESNVQCSAALETAESYL